jgi:anti-anti-sigma factor
VKVRSEGGIVIVTPKGWLVGGDETDQLEDLIRRQLTDGNRRMAVDLTEVVMMNSLAVGTLVGCRQSYKSRDGHIVLCGLNQRLVRIFLLTQLTLVFELHETLEEALAALEHVA